MKKVDKFLSNDLLNEAMIVANNAETDNKIFADVYHTVFNQVRRGKIIAMIAVVDRIIDEKN